MTCGKKLRRNSAAYSRVIALSQSTEDILKKTVADADGIDNWFPPEVRP
ncbi:MAG TPA: hypothetical protein VLD55_02250 [Candidatus Sulfobium mesophilum]|nr:hypothetical protein [Thermodesulfobacteriota bacterium]HSB30399.1 hypothetical protein [Candidatus Sulfobium mesophilum]